jgi:DNA-binding transcriptional ArsR family regulator
VTARIVLPDSRFDIADFGELVGDPSRVTMLLSLMDGLARPATELARLAGIKPQTASFHLQRLVAGRLVRVDSSGRHRYFRLAGDRVAEALEAVSLLSAPRRRPPASEARQALARGRLCYRHLAGRLGVACLHALERAGFLRVRGGALALTRSGIAWFESSGRCQPRWPAGRPCLDWTERRNHLGGPLGALLADHLLSLGWIARAEDGRAVRVTEDGRRELARQLAIDTAALPTAAADEPGRSRR